MRLRVFAFFISSFVRVPDLAACLVQFLSPILGVFCASSRLSRIGE